MANQFSRTELLIGKAGMQKLKDAKVVIFGIGGVGSFALEALARAGIGNFILVDHDIITETNLNRQIIATTKTIGRPKVEVAKERILEINPKAKVETSQEFFSRDTTEIFDESISYVIDCIDTVSSKLEIIKRAKKLEIPVISCMGTGNKLDPSQFEVADIGKTSVCPLAKTMRRELRKQAMEEVKVVYSKEEPIPVEKLEEDTGKKIVGSISFVPSAAGLMLAGEVIKDLIKSSSFGHKSSIL